MTRVVTVGDVAFVTEDRWMREEGGSLDATDRQLLWEASGKEQSRVRVITVRQMMEDMRNTEPSRFDEFHKQMESQAGIPLTFDGLVELGRKADLRMKEYEEVVAPMTLGQAAQVRHWRVGRRTWRSVARVAYAEGWFGRYWSPPSNQLAGMALCERAAELHGENYREEPWN